MSDVSSPDMPLWVQDRDTVITKDPDVEWRYGAPPDYSRNNAALKQQSKYNHSEGSLEALVQNLVRTFEMEASFKTDPQQWLSVVTDKFRMRTNTGLDYTANDILAAGTYNLFLRESEHYSAKSEDFESIRKNLSRRIFQRLLMGTY